MLANHDQRCLRSNSLLITHYSSLSLGYFTWILFRVDELFALRNGPANDDGLRYRRIHWWTLRAGHCLEGDRDVRIAHQDFREGYRTIILHRDLKLVTRARVWRKLSR